MFIVSVLITILLKYSIVALLVYDTTGNTNYLLSKT